MKTMSIAAAMAACASLAVSQPAPNTGPPAVLQVTREMIKEGKGAAHRRVEQDYANAFRKNKFPHHYLGLSAESGPNEALFLAGFSSFAAMEEGDQLTQKAPLKNDLELVEARDGELRTESRTLTAIYRQDLSYLPDNALPVGKFRYVMLDNYRVRLGQNDRFLEGAKTILAGYRKANLSISVVCYQVVAGAPNGVFLFLVPMDSLKMMDDGPAREKALTDAVGADVLRSLRSSEGDLFQNMESTLYAVSPEMSYLSKEDEDVDPSFWRPKVTAAHPASKETAAAKPAPPKP